MPLELPVMVQWKCSMGFMRMENIITIDGGAASGKSSTSRLLAQRLNLLHVDTGSHYRSLTHALMRLGCDPKEHAQVVIGLEQLSLDSRIEGRQSRILINGSPVDEEQLRSEEVNQQVSAFASIPEVRAKLLDYQRSQVELCEPGGFAGLVMEGRDIGSVVFPDARWRFYLEADAATRQARRELEGQVDSIQQRDQMDAGRKTAPLKIPDGAVRIDSSALTLEQVVARVVSAVNLNNTAG